MGKNPGHQENVQFVSGLLCRHCVRLWTHWENRGEGTARKGAATCSLECHLFSGVPGAVNGAGS